MASSTYKGDYKKGEIEISQSNLIFENQYAKIYNDDVIFPSGYQGTYIRICNPQPQSVAVLPITRDQKVLLIKTFRHGARGWGYEVPKGGVDRSEEMEKAALRELWEETGYTAERLIDLGEYFDSPAVFGNPLKCYIAVNCYRLSEPSCEKTEAIEKTIAVEIEDYIKGQYRLDFNDALTEMLICRYAMMIGGKKDES